MTITTRLYTYFNGKLVGEDAYGNRYFTEKNPEKKCCGGGRAKRWVIYNGLSEPSKVPPSWFGWLHYINDTVPSITDSPRHAWEKPHQPNLTGTKNAYAPTGSLREAEINAKHVGNYEAWQPK